MGESNTSAGPAKSALKQTYSSRLGIWGPGSTTPPRATYPGGGTGIHIVTALEDPLNLHIKVKSTGGNVAGRDKEEEEEVVILTSLLLLL
jgi:hypothetical protein